MNKCSSKMYIYGHFDIIFYSVTLRKCLKKWHFIQNWFIKIHMFDCNLFPTLKKITEIKILFSSISDVLA